MANVVVTFKVMMESTEVNVDSVKDIIADRIQELGGEVGRLDVEPIAFGLNSVVVVFIWDENKGDTEKLEEEVKKIEGVSNVDVVDVRRSFI